MQLIAEPETTIDIEKTMSAVGNLQNKVETLETGDFTNKCNGNKQMQENSNDKKEMFSEIETALANMHADLENSDAEVSKVDLSKIISEKNSHGDVQIEESQNSSLETDTNGVNADEIENMEESKEIPEEDYLEDDIISISEEPYKEISQAQKDATDTVINKDEISASQLILVEEEDKQETPQNECQPLIENNDIIEVLEETENTIPSEKESQMQQEKDKVIPSEKESQMQQEKDKVIPGEKESQMQQEKDKVIPSEKESETQQEKDKVIEKSENTLSEIQKENDEVDLIEELKHEKETESMEEEIDKIDTAIESEISCENNKKIPTEDLKQNDVGTAEQIKEIPSESENKTVILEETDEVEIIKDAEHNSSQSDSQADKIETVIEEEKNDKCEEHLDSLTEDKDDIELIEEPEKPSDVVEDKTDASKDAEITTNGIKSMENQDTHIDEAPKSPKCQPTVEIRNVDAVDSLAVLKDDAMDVDESKTALESNDAPIELKDDMDVEEVTDKTTSNNKVILELKDTATNTAVTAPAPVSNNIDKPIICKLSNTLDILSDDEEELPKVDVKTSPKVAEEKENQSINIEDDDDIMLIDEDANKTETIVPVENKVTTETVAQPETEKVVETSEKILDETNDDLFDKIMNIDNEEAAPPSVVETQDTTTEINIKEKTPEPKIDEVETPLPLIPDNFVKTAKKKLSDMTRDELEEFCILKIVESIVDRGSLTDIKNKLLSMTQALDEHRKKAMMLTKQNRDLQVVLKSVQEEQKKATGNTPITPLKITRSVGMQVYMEKTVPRKKGQQQNMNNKNIQNKNMMQAQGPRTQKQINQTIPVPRLVPAHNPALKNPNTVPQINQMNTPSKASPANGIIKNPSPVTKSEKRPFNKISSVTVDLTDDEPPAKMPGGPKTSPAPPVRLVPPQNLMGPRYGTSVNSPRKVYIPISGPQNQALRPGQTIMLKTVAAGLRPRGPSPQVSRVEQSPVRINRIAPRHPAPLPFAMKQYQPPNWKALPPPPDLKLSKVENGIVISWKIEDVPEDSYEEIASYQLYAYQETSLPPSTNLWKKIGDVKALPLPMACTLTQFMAGYKYYFAVRAVDIRSRLGPFSLPGSILLLSKSM